MKKIIIILAVIIGVVCSAKDITVSAAASLKDVMQEIKKSYESEVKEDKIQFNFGGSGALQQQIENGAPVDVFIAAAPKQVDELIKKGIADKSTKIDLLINEVVLIVPKESKNAIKNYNGLEDISIKKIGIGEPASVPAGQYSLEIFKNLGIAEKISSKLIYAKDVRGVLSWVETENVDAGIVYRTDALLSDKIKIICAAPKGSHAPVIYPGVIITDSKCKEEGKQFLKYLNGEKASKIFEKYGFTVIN